MADKPSRPARGSRRMLKLAGMTASLAGRYAGNKLASAVRSEEQRKAARARLNQQAGDHLADTLGELKGAVMKLGQFASQVSDLLPEDIANAVLFFCSPLASMVTGQCIAVDGGSGEAVIY